MLKNWCFQTVVLEKTLESPLDCKIKPVNPKGNQSWIFTGRTDDEAEALVWCEVLTHWKWSCCWERLRAGGEGATENEMVGGHPWLNGHEFLQIPGHSEGQEAWCAEVHGVAKSKIQLSYRTTRNDRHTINDYEDIKKHIFYKNSDYKTS